MIKAEDIDLDLFEQLRGAVRANDVQGVRDAIASGANVRWRGNSALKNAAQNGDVEVVKVLLDAGADVRAKDDWALRWTRTAEMFDILFNTGAYDNWWPYDKRFPDNDTLARNRLKIVSWEQRQMKLINRGKYDAGFPEKFNDSDALRSAWEKRLIEKTVKEKSQEKQEGLGL